jgi:CDP-paratose 2-epimerase
MRKPAPESTRHALPRGRASVPEKPQLLIGDERRLNDHQPGLTLITGGAGFIGSNLAASYLSRGLHVRVFDNLSRPGTEKNLAWLRSLGSERLEVSLGDVRDEAEVSRAVADADLVIHLASQVAVTTSVVNPRVDFEVNALGTINVLEAARASSRRPVVLLASTNKVYGGMEDLTVERTDEGYRFRDLPMGVSEERPLDFHSPYGCSKGSADQYVRDYARIYGLRTVVFRQSCIYGPRQFGNEDQGWVAHFALSALFGRPITIFGDGHQVRDVLHVDDLIAAFDLAVQNISATSGQIYNIGGGSDNSLSLRSLLSILEDVLGKSVEVGYSDWRPGDQRVYVSDIRRAKAQLSWTPRIGARDGVSHLLGWAQENPELFGS